jgi:hypothetical protein
MKLKWYSSAAEAKKRFPDEKSLTPAMKNLLVRMRKGDKVYRFNGPLGGWWIQGHPTRNTTRQMVVLNMLGLVREAPPEKQTYVSATLWEATP